MIGVDLVLDHLVDEESFPLLVQLLADEAGRVRWHALHALAEAHERDPEPAVREKAGWYVPGGIIYRRTAPKQTTRRKRRIGWSTASPRLS